ncbi:uncharacterized protein Z519_06733 [Cladophialophora bantiana CBS 173.52]|uniref:Uncharacterized protein n=1 Tax=Cladophialophora bantiana (strain ATCC 10958 / CBS 173.52 / CDC B-1940 / NIH 8579) TaxID=1442370 RepID=A0A0D2I7U3_CLAB1|nr:uncharacterized protein Z519_06733 [Cladophialophora bantiana CBS 173.52]KIW92884.1 hypothetical protein Z519_06733 [Cladophialophora bantiana CBS 173.52]
MEQNALEYSDNDINVTSQSTVHITLCLSGATDLLAPEAVSPLPPRPLPFRTTSHAERPVEMPCNTRGLNSVRENGQDGLALGTFSHTTPYWPSTPRQVEIPTFIFGRPSVDQTVPETQQRRVPAGEKQSAVVWGCGGYATDRSEEESETDYDAVTQAHFSRHLGVIDCSSRFHSQHKKGQEAGNAALWDYNLQLRLLEQQNKKRLMVYRASAT